MAIDSPLEYTVIFITGVDLKKASKNFNFFGSLKVEENLYSILIDKESKVKDWMLLEIPKMANLFKNQYFKNIKRPKTLPPEYCVFRSDFNFIQDRFDLGDFNDFMDSLDDFN